MIICYNSINHCSAVNHSYVAFLKDRVECLVFDLDLGSPDAVAPNVLVERASSIFELGLWMQTVHSLAIVGS